VRGASHTVDRPIRVCFLVRQLNLGGAQRQLLELVRGLDKRRFSPVIVALYPGGEFSTEASSIAGAPYICIGKRGRWHIFGFLWRLTREIDRLRPDIIQGYIGVCNILAAMVHAFRRSTRVIWSIRNSAAALDRQERLARFQFRIERLLSGVPDAIIANSEAGKKSHIANGYPAEKIIVIHNAVDTARFQPDAGARMRTRQAWGIAPQTTVIGMAGRIDPLKDHALFVRAAALVANRGLDVRFVVVGDGPAEHVTRMQRLVSDLGLQDLILWTGGITDMPAAYNAMDIFTSCSQSEGFSNVLCEAMSCGLPCVATAVGDSAFIVGDAGITISRHEPDCLAAAWIELLERGRVTRAALGRRARSRIQDICAQELLAQRTSAVFEGVL
jgi:glycosyltransferase involved in cell wall biosynthesis